MYSTGNEMLAIEVKSRDSNWHDLRRGIFQCIKYRAVLQAQERTVTSVDVLLVSERGLPADLTRLAKCPSGHFVSRTNRLGAVAS